MEKVRRYAETGAGDVKMLRGDLRPKLRLRAGDFRIIFTQDDETIIVAGIGPRGGIYD